MKSLGAITLSVIMGAMVGSIFMALTLPQYTASGALSSSNFDNAFVTILYGFLGGIFGLFTSLVVLALIRREYFSQLGFGQIFSLVIVFGLVHSLVFAALEYHNATEGMQPPVLDKFAVNVILRTAVTAFISGSLIGGISILAVKYSEKSE